MLAAFGVLPDGIMGMLIGGGIGVLFILLGNYMPRARQNYTFGCRTPWALADEHNWARTQRMGGITFIIMGAVILLTACWAAFLAKYPCLFCCWASRWAALYGSMCTVFLCSKAS